MTDNRSPYMSRKMSQLRAFPTYSSETTKIWKGQELLCLDSNENLQLPLSLLKRVMQEAIDLIDPRIYSANMQDDLAKQLAEYLGVDPSSIIFGSGGDGLIQMLASSFMTDGESAVVVEPSFKMYSKNLRMFGRTVKSVYLGDEFKIEVDKIIKSLRGDNEVVFICSPNNPTGNQFPLDDVLAITEATQGLVVVDEAYAEFADYTLVESLWNYDNLVILRTFSKAFGLAGLRIGFAVTDDAFADILRKHVLPPFPVSTFSMLVARLLLENIEEVRKSIKDVRVARAKSQSYLGSIDGIRLFPSDANFLLIRVPIPSVDAQDRLLDCGIKVRVVDWIEDGANYIRLTVPPLSEVSRVKDCFEEAFGQ